jgi:hypothetical protein
MATLVLTAVGTALGGPIGGALGALAGNALDHAVFSPGRRREGPRLSDLRVQVSHYGAPIPKLFGTMRVAGTVIWATDLIEERATSGGGKGRPTTTQYSYRANFAVLLSGRPIAGVGRIWADGQLLRGAGGDWKAGTGFRLHLGGEDQAPDPLIASVEGLARTPAHRGCAYAVFEGLELARFGNRIPSLSFEVIADAGPAGVGAIARALAQDVTGAPALSLDGYAAAGGSVRGALDGLAEAAGAWWSPAAGGLMLRDGATVDAEVVADPARDTRDLAAEDAAPAVVSLSYYDPARDWQAGLQRARRAGEGPTLALELPAAMAAGAAKGIADATLRRAEAGRTRRVMGVGLDGLARRPGDVVHIVGEVGRWRVEAVTLDRDGAALALRPLAPRVGAATASAGRALPAPDRPAGGTILYAAELPALDDALLSQPRLVIWGSGSGAGWRRAGLLLSLDDGASWTDAGATAAPAVVGVVEVAPGPGTAALVDQVSQPVVRLARADMMLADADRARLDAGANLALIGGELVQFGRAEPLGGARWRLSELWRGRRAMAGPIAPGDRFVLIEADATRTVDLPLAALGGTVRVMASGVGDTEPVQTVVAITGVSVAPPSPVALRVDGDAVRWTRRSRAGWRWLDRVDAPLSEESEMYRVSVAGAGGVRELVTDAPAVALTPAERTGAVVTVRQRGTHAESVSATLTI